MNRKDVKKNTLRSHHLFNVSRKKVKYIGFDSGSVISDYIIPLEFIFRLVLGIYIN